MSWEIRKALSGAAIQLCAQSLKGISRITKQVCFFPQTYLHGLFLEFTFWKNSSHVLLISYKLLKGSDTWQYYGCFVQRCNMASTEVAGTSTVPLSTYDFIFGMFHRMLSVYMALDGSFTASREDCMTVCTRALLYVLHKYGSAMCMSPNANFPFYYKCINLTSSCEDLYASYAIHCSVCCTYIIGR